jgi:hypothetical protein
VSKPARDSKPPDPRSGVQEDGSWVPSFEGQRPPFEPGNTLTVGHGRPAEHGAYAELALSPRAEALSARLRELGADHLTPADDAGLAVAALSALQLSCATGALEEVTEAIERGDDVDVWLGRLESRSRLSQDARRWSDTTRRWFDSLGLTPAGRAQLEAAQHPPGISIGEAQAFVMSCLQVATEFIDAANRAAFLARFDATFRPVIGELPPPDDSVDARNDAGESEPS